MIEILYLIDLIIIGAMFYFNAKITEVTIIQNINILMMKDLYFTKVYKYANPDERKNVSIFNDLDKEELFSYMKRKAWNPLRSIVPFEFGFLTPAMRKAVVMQNRFLKHNHHMAFIVSAKEDFQRDIKKMQKEMQD